MHHPSSDGWRHFSRKDPEKVLYLHKVLKSSVFSNHTEAFAVFFSSPGKHVCITMYFSSADMPVRSTTGLADGSPSPLCPNREVLAALPQQHIWEGHSTAL